MTARPSVGPARFLDGHLARASPDLLRSMVSDVGQTLLRADADAVCRASYRQLITERVALGNGHRHGDRAPPRSAREVPHRAVTIDLAILKLHAGRYLHDPARAGGRSSATWPLEECPGSSCARLTPTPTLTPESSRRWPRRIRTVLAAMPHAPHRERDGHLAQKCLARGDQRCGAPRSTSAAPRPSTPTPSSRRPPCRGSWVTWSHP